MSQGQAGVRSATAPAQRAFIVTMEEGLGALQAAMDDLDKKTEIPTIGNDNVCIVPCVCSIVTPIHVPCCVCGCVWQHVYACLVPLVCSIVTPIHPPIYMWLCEAVRVCLFSTTCV